MHSAKSITYGAYDTVQPSINGFQFQIDGVKFMFRNCFVVSGQLSIAYLGPSVPAELQIPDGVRPCLKISSLVSHFGVNGHTLTNFSFGLSWKLDGKETVVTGVEMANASVNAFFDALSKTENELGKLFEQMDMAHLASLAKVASLPLLKDWNNMPNYAYPVASSAPNPLNAKEASDYAKLPQVVTMLSLCTSDLQYYLTCKLTHHQGIVQSITTEFYHFADYGKKGARAKLVHSQDMTHLFDQNLLFYYTTYWTSSYKVPEGTPLDLYLGAFVPFYNSMVQGGPGPVSIAFNFKMPELYNEGQLFPIAGNMMCLPVKTA